MVAMASWVLFLFSLFLLLCHQKSMADSMTSATSHAGAWESFNRLVNLRKGDSMHEIAQLKHYLSRFGYLNLTCINNSKHEAHFDDHTEAALKLYQQSFSLPPTGVLDQQTLHKMLTPRCGRADVVNGIPLMLNKPHPHQHHHQHQGHGYGVAHYTYFPNRPIWPSSRRRLTYAFSPRNETQRVSRQQKSRIFANAFKAWAAVVPLSFTEIDEFERADVKIEFVRYGHGDGEPFDGVLGILAHAFSPGDGRFHLDDSEFWASDVSSDENPQAIDLQSVVTHEIGHLLGLGHSAIENAIMYPSISPHQIKTQLQQDDIQGVQSLYGVNPGYKPLPADAHVSLHDINSGLPLASSLSPVHIFAAFLFLFYLSNIYIL